MKKIITLLSGIAILLGIFFTLTALQQAGVKTPQEEITLEEEEKIEEGKYIVSRKDIAEKLSFKEAREEIVSFNVPGVIEDIFVKEGDQVKQGDTLVILKVAGASLQELNQAKEGLNQAQANLSFALTHPNTYQIEYWDQSIVDDAQSHLANVIAQANQSIEIAQSQVDFYQNEFNKIINQINNASNSKTASILKSQTKAALIKAYFVLDQTIWLHDKVQTTYFVRNDQWSLKVREKEAEAFRVYYTVKWYMENLILDEPADWTITECLEQAKDALQKLIIAYNTTLDALKDPFYSPQLTQDDKEDIDEAREDIAKALALIVETQARWKNRDSSPENNLTSLEAQKAHLENLLRAAKNHLKEVKTKAQSLIAEADQNLKKAYSQALKTKTVTTPKNTAALQNLLNQAQEKYTKLLSQTTQEIKLKAGFDGTVNKTLVLEGKQVEAGEAILKIIPQNNKELEVREKKNALVIPKEYLVEKDDKNFVKMMREGEMALQEIRTGIINGEWVEVLEGLEERDTIFLPED